MVFHFPPGKYPKQVFNEKLYTIRLNHSNKMKFIAMLQEAGFVEMRGSKIIVIKKELLL